MGAGYLRMKKWMGEWLPERKALVKRLTVRGPWLSSKIWPMTLTLNSPSEVQKNKVSALSITDFLKSSPEDMLIDFRERRRGREIQRERETKREERKRERRTENQRQRETSTWTRNIDWLPPVSTLTGDQTHSLGMCPDQGSNPQPSDVWDNIPTEPPGQSSLTFLFVCLLV